jgi:hypothetical protein
VIVELLKIWQGFPVGHRLEDLQDGVALILIERGIASAIDSGVSDRADSGPDHTKRSEKTARNRNK